MSEPNVIDLTLRARTAMHRLGKGHHYAGLGLWCHGIFTTEQIHIVDNDDGFGVQLRSPLKQVLWMDKRDAKKNQMDLSLFAEAMVRIDRLMLLDDLASI